MMPMAGLRFMGIPSCADASTTGAMWLNFIRPSTTRNATTRPVMIRPAHTLPRDGDAACMRCSSPGFPHGRTRRIDRGTASGVVDRQRADVVHLPEGDGVVPQDRVGGGDVEVEV